MSPLYVELQAHSVVSTNGTTVWKQEVEQCMERLPRNLYTLNRGKISPVGRNDTLLIKLSILSVVTLVENTTTQGAGYVMCSHAGAWEQEKNIHQPTGMYVELH